MISDTLDDTLKQMLQYYRDLYRIEPGVHLTELPTLDIDQTYQQIIDWMLQSVINELENIPTDVDSWTDGSTNMSMDEWIEYRITQLQRKVKGELHRCMKTY